MTIANCVVPHRSMMTCSAASLQVNEGLTDAPSGLLDFSMKQELEQVPHPPGAWSSLIVPLLSDLTKACTSIECVDMLRHFCRSALDTKMQHARNICLDPVCSVCI